MPLTAEKWLEAVQKVVGGKVRPDTTTPSAPRTFARLTAINPEDIGHGMYCAKHVVVDRGLVDITDPLASIITSYIPGNIQFSDVTKNQPRPFWFHLENFDSEIGKYRPFYNIIVIRLKNMSIFVSLHL